MNKRITHCLLCERELHERVGWRELLVKTLPTTICLRCEQRFEKIPPNDNPHVTSLYQYNEPMKDFLHRYKFLRDVMLAHIFNRILHEQLKNESRLIIPIPMHAESKKIRTFAHVDELLNAAHIPFVHHLVKLSKEQQSLKTRKERLQTPQLFDVIHAQEIQQQSILLIDDIYTTGTTLAHAKSVLLHAGAKSVDGFTLIRSEMT